MSDLKTDICPVCGQSISKWNLKRYHLRQLMPAKDVVAVFVHDDGELSTLPLLCLALAEIVRHRLTGHLGAEKCRYRTDLIVESETEIVGIDMLDGYCEVIDNNSNFAGLCWGIQDPWKCLGQLNWSCNKEFEKAAKEKGRTF